MPNNIFGSLMAFLTRLENESIYYTLAHSRENAMVVTVFIPSECWEIEFLEDGSVEAEQFVSNGKLYGDNLLDDLFERFAEQQREVLEHPQYASLVADA